MLAALSGTRATWRGGAYNAEYRKRKSQNIEGQKTLMQAWEKARAPFDSAVLPPRSILQGVALASPDSTESEVEDTEDPWELQRLHDAWLAKEFFYKKKKNYAIRLVEDDRGAGRGDTEDPWELQRLHDAWLEKEFFKKKNNGAKKWPVKGCPDCGTLVSSPSMARHRRLSCKSRQLLSLQQDLRSMSAVLLCMRAAVAAAVPAVGDAPADEA